MARRTSPFDILLPYQRTILDSASSKIVCLCSRQIGKSFVAAAKAVRHAILHPNSLTACISTGERAGKEFLLKVVQWADVLEAFAGEEGGGLLSHEATATEVRFANGSRVIMLPSGNPRALRGYTGNLILDEFALVENDKDVWAAIAPTLTSKMSGNKWILVLSTPTALDTEFAKIWNSPPELGWEKHKLTIHDAVQQGLRADPDALEALINDDFIWRTEYLCEFASTADIAFPPEWFGEAGRVYQYNPRLPVSIGVDVARTSDLTVFVATQEDESGVTHVLKTKRLHKTPFAVQLQELKAFVAEFNFSSGYIDATGIGAMFAEEAARTISARLKPFVFSANKKTEIFERLRKVAQENHLAFDPSEKDIIVSDLAQLRRMYDARAIHYTAPHTKSGHADLACALALSVAASHDIPRSNALPVWGSIPSQWGSVFGSRMN